ncbi:RNA-directed DNA polymerase from mobile element jockey [Trichonephila clavipes]|nr:RNA-directed DNA polymerase from mobile element jockey [Trichonephila clavipes]
MGNVLVQRYVPIATRRGKGPLTNAAVARRISKFEATGCLDDRPRSGRPSTRRNAAETVKDEMETVAMHGEVSARTVETAFHTLLFGWHLGVPSDAIRTKSIGIMNCYLAIP